MLDTLIEIVPHAFLKGLFANDFADVFVYEGILLESFPCAHSKAFFLRPNDVDRRILPFLKP